MIRYGIKWLRFHLGPTVWETGIVHYYGRAWSWDTEELVRLTWHMIRHKINEYEARRINVKDSVFDLNSSLGRYKPGDVTGRFEQLDKLITEGVRMLREEFGPDIKIEIGDPMDLKPEIYSDPPEPLKAEDYK